MVAMGLSHAEAMTGSYFMRDVDVTGTVRPLSGESHLVGVRIQGAMRGYYGGLHGRDRAALLHNVDGTVRVLAEAPFAWTPHADYAIRLVAQGDSLALWINGAPVLQALEPSLAYGMAGYAQYAMGRTWFGDMTLQEL